MSAGDLLGFISLGVSLLLGVLVFVTNRRANKTSEKKLSVEEQEIEDNREDVIAKRRKEELDRLYQRVDKLEKIVDELQRRDREKQTTIDDQAGELERTNRLLADVRRLFVRYTARVERAWADGHTMPTLTEEERALLENTIPRSDLDKLTTKEKS